MRPMASNSADHAASEPRLPPNSFCLPFQRKLAGMPEPLTMGAVCRKPAGDRIKKEAVRLASGRVTEVMLPGGIVGVSHHAPPAAVRLRMRRPVALK